MILITINSSSFLINKTLSVLEACKFLGLTIPRFCYHESLSIAGNCRMCLIELENSPKPIASCALPISSGMHIFLNTPLVKKARENVLETILINHPLDCPICDQAGECDLQDQTMEYGISNVNRFYFLKRNIEDKKFNILIKTVMTRCILCTRCVRFVTEITGSEELGVLNRGNSMEIGNYINLNTTSELSGNVIDLCPVGALTSKPYAFKVRPWELKTIESVDITDSFGSSIYIQYKDTTVMRILPKIYLNNNFITDRARFFFDSLIYQRLYKIFIKDLTNNLFINITHERLLLELLNFFKQPTKLLMLISFELGLQTLLLLKALMFKFNKILTIRTIYKTSMNLNYIKLNSYFKSSDFQNAEPNVICLFSTNLRVESAILNSKLRLKFLTKTTKIFNLSSFYKINYKVQFVNLNIKTLINVLEGKLLLLSKLLLKSKKIICFFGENLFKRGFLNNTFETLLYKFIPKINIIRILLHCNTESVFLTNILPLNKQKYLQAHSIFALNLDSTTFLYKHLYFFKNNIHFKKYNLTFSKLITKSQLFKKTFLAFFNTHGSELCNIADLNVPITSYMEEENTFINMNLKPQKTFTVFTISKDIHSIEHFIHYFLSFSTTKKVKLFKYASFNTNLIEDSRLNLPLNQFNIIFNIKIRDRKSVV